MFTYTHAVNYTTLSSDIRHYCRRKPGAPNCTGDTKVVWSWATPRNAAVRHQRARYAVWPDTSQTTRRGIRRHEATRTVLDSDVYTSIHIYLYIFMYTYLYIFMYTYTYTYININIWIYIYIYIYGYTYLYEYVDMVGTSPTSRSAVTRHQRVRDAVWSG